MAGIVKVNLLCHRPADVVACQCIKPPFFSPISDLLSLFCHGCSVLVPWMWTGSIPSFAGAEGFCPALFPCFRGWRTSWSAELSAWWPPIWSQGKNWGSKIFQYKLFIPAHSVEPLSSCCQELFFWSGFWKALGRGEALMAIPSTQVVRTLSSL